MEPIKIQSFDGMINIEHSGLEYGNIKGMYKTGNGHGLQISQPLEPKRLQIEETCANIADLIYKLHDLLEEG